jgi:hypothetical protein
LPLTLRAKRKRNTRIGAATKLIQKLRKEVKGFRATMLEKSNHFLADFIRHFYDGVYNNGLFTIAFIIMSFFTMPFFIMAF